MISALVPNKVFELRVKVKVLRHISAIMQMDSTILNALDSNGRSTRDTFITVVSRKNYT